jgi:hypothetical protein
MKESPVLTLVEKQPTSEEAGVPASVTPSSSPTATSTPDAHMASDTLPVGKPHEKFSVFWFTVQVLAQVAGLIALLKFGLPGVWKQQLSATPAAFAACFLGMHLFMCFFEWAFHRYVLHGLVSPILLTFVRAHRNHHGLTPIKLQSVSQGSDRFVLNRYPIMGADQYEDSAFPWFATMGFWAFFTPMLVGVQLLLPNMPVLLGGYAAITFSMALYEILHAIEHLPYEWWKGATEHPVFGRMWNRDLRVPSLPSRQRRRERGHLGLLRSAGGGLAVSAPTTSPRSFCSRAAWPPPRTSRSSRRHPRGCEQSTNGRASASPRITRRQKSRA